MLTKVGVLNVHLNQATTFLLQVEIGTNHECTCIN